MTGFLSASRHHPVRYWRQGATEGEQNFGDFLTELFLDRLLVLPDFPADIFHLVGSVITEHQMRDDLQRLQISPQAGIIAFWGCGLRDAQPLSDWARKHARFFGIRGPHSRDILGLPADTVLGDPGLLLPILHPVTTRGGGGSLCIVHMLDPKPAAQIQAETGADHILHAGIPRSEAALRAFIDRLCQADFVLTNALHGAIAACAYGIPFAYYDSGHLDVPFKWGDFAASVGLPNRFATTVAEGIALYREELAPAYRPLPLLPILTASPFSVRPRMLLRAAHHDGHLSDDILKALLAATPEDRAVIAEAQSEWLHRAALRKSKGKAEFMAVLEPPGMPVPPPAAALRAAGQS